jgi:predicted Zn-dependent protease
MHMPRRSRILAASATLAIVLGFLGAAPASANWYGANGALHCHGNEADNDVHGYYRYRLTSPYSSAMTWVANYLNSKTAVTAKESSELTDLTDQIVSDDYYKTVCDVTWWTPDKGGVMGFATCESLTNARSCEQHKVWLSNYYSADSSITTNDLRSLVLHETGHALGLDHIEDRSDAMYGSPKALVYSPHSLRHLSEDL